MKILIKKTLIIALFTILLCPMLVLANDWFQPQVEIPGGYGAYNLDTGLAIGAYLSDIYKYATGIVSIVATVILMYGGVRWIAAGGNAEAVGDAKEWIKAALTGLILIITSYTLLYFVNPDLVRFKSVKIDTVEALPEKKYTENAEHKSCCVIYTPKNHSTKEYYTDNPICTPVTEKCSNENWYRITKPGSCNDYPECT